MMQRTMVPELRISDSGKRGRFPFSSKKVAGYFFPTLGGNTITAFYGFPRTVTGTVSFRF